MNWFSSLMGNLNYWTVFLLMYIEGTVIPVPSELIVSPAAYHAAAGHLDVTLVIIFATLGAVLGSATNYVAAYYLGRPIVYRFANSKLGHLCLLNQEKIEKSEKYFNDHGVIATLTGRLLPGIRQVISVPAGLAKMKFWKFILYTTIGAGIWNCVLAALGWYLHSIVPEEQLNDKILEYNDHIKVVILSLFGLMVAYFIIKHFLNKRKQNKTQSSNPS
ncbi:SNARE-like domain protein [Hoylesella buccalis ATCC 35310]|uniref:SNARE-like domain protein n=1 Tax=Hoylesella buccalis ATCC 35310 TaxID=679190 RepID=D1W3N0_9BACT|nr:DedA family protein [Hoylesella buccalis]EFA92777.1 SNARE-like domain protein [Hoylesella buccalis ATCC 35310]